MTYNLHRGRGLDGRTSFARQAEIIAEAEPDIVAVQEITKRDDASDLGELCEVLRWQSRFVLAQTRPSSEYGHGLLTRGEVEEAETLELPGHDSRETEPRTAARHVVRIDGQAIAVVSTHLALTTLERDAQIRAIVDSGWIEAPCILLGDLNCTPRSSALEALAPRMVRAGGWRHRTWPALLPLFPLDHIYVTRDIEVQRATTITTGAARWASDHVPFVADLRLP